MIATKIKHLGSVETMTDFNTLRKFWKANPNSPLKFSVYKFINKEDFGSWYRGSKRPIITYLPNKVIRINRELCDSSNRECGAGINVATKCWVDDGCLGSFSKKEISMECAVKDIVAMPKQGQGKFRVCRVKVENFKTTEE
jgi:hypothetical protein